MPRKPSPRKSKSVGSRKTRPKAVMGPALQLLIGLDESEPLVWRRIVVPATFTFWDLHMAIQNAMGWENYHLHIFECADSVTKRPREIGIPDPDLHHDKKTEPGWKVTIAPFFASAGDTATYTYDFGDNWHHYIVLEAILTPPPTSALPTCADGARACPPEDCGGIWGYQAIVKGELDAEMREWVGDYDPTKFEAAKVRFSDPAPVLKQILEEY